MKLPSNRAPVVIAAAVLGILVAGLFIWTQYRKTLPNAIYEGGSLGNHTNKGATDLSDRATDGTTTNAGGNMANRVRAQKGTNR